MRRLDTRMLQMNALLIRQYYYTFAFILSGDKPLWTLFKIFLLSNTYPLGIFSVKHQELVLVRSSWREYSTDFFFFF